MTQMPEPIHEQVKLQPSMGNTPFQNAFDNAALTPTALGQFGAQVALSASTALNQARGYEAGKNPSGTPLPALTKADQAFNEAYTTEAQTTLGLQATKLMEDSQNEINKARQLTPENIALYSKSVGEGIQEILNNAPMQLKPAMEAQYGSSLIRTTGALQDKMFAQQRAISDQNASIFNQNQISSMYDAARNGQVDSAKEMYTATLARATSMMQSGQMTPLQAEAMNKSARISYYSGIYTAEALNAYHNKTADEYLAHLIDNKPADIHQEEWEGIAKNVMGEVSNAEAFQHRNEQSLYSEGNRLMAEGKLTSDFLVKLEKQTTNKPLFNDFMAKVAVNQRKVANANVTSNALAPLFGNVDAMAVATEKTKDTTLQQLTQVNSQRAAQLGTELTPFESMSEIMANAGTPVKSYTNVMNSGLLSGNAQLMERNIKAYQALNRNNPKVLLGVTDQAKAMMTAYEGQINGGNSPEAAALNAKQIVMAQSPVEREETEHLISQWERKVNTTSKLNSWASDFAINSDNALIPNPDFFAMKVKDMFKANMRLLKGDVDGAHKMTEDGINQTWGTTNVNGKPEFVYMPVEKALGTDDRARPLIQDDIHEQVAAQIAHQKEIYDAGVKANDHRVNFYYKLSERPDFEKFMAAKKTVQDYENEQHKHAFAGGHLNIEINTTFGQEEKLKPVTDAKAIIDQYQNGELTLEKIYTGGHVEKYQVIVQANPTLAITDKGMIGDYNISIRKDGRTSPLTGIFRGPNDWPIYRPNGQKISQRYVAVNGINPSGMSAKDYYNNVWLPQEAKAKEELQRPTRMGVF